MAMVDLSIVMPCQNEEKTVGQCVNDAKDFMTRRRLHGEILIIDNGSTDESAGIAREHGAQVIPESRPGYGYALRRGIDSAQGKVILMGDCDATYDFLHLDALYNPLAAGACDMMIGDRFAGGISKGAMPMNHRIGVRVLSALGRLRFRTEVRDFHCGLRGLTKEAAQRLDFQTTGMEFATEMIALAMDEGLTIGQCPVKLGYSPPGRSKLRPLPDGFRHLKYIVTFHSPKTGR